MTGLIFIHQYLSAPSQFSFTVT